MKVGVRDFKMGMLENAKPENCFYCADGSVLHNISELRQKLKTITPQAFYHHVSQSKNDFYNWIRDVFQDYELANDILKAKTPAAAAATVDRHLKKALLAKEEIEQAISRIIKAQAKAITSAPPAAAKRPKRNLQTKKKKPRQRQQRQKKQPPKVQKAKGKAKNRKLNKKLSTRITKISGKHIHNNRSSRGRSGKRGKKQVNMWLKWLKLVPEL